jgi:outer membrane lipoprotein-sorting protein
MSDREQEQPNDEQLEQRLRDALKQDATTPRAPADLWSRVSERIHDRPPARTNGWHPSRWLAVPATAVAIAVAIGAFTIFLPRLGSDDEEDADDLLVRVAEAAEDPESVGLESYVGEIEVTFEEPDFQIEDDLPAEFREPTTGRTRIRIWLAGERYRVETESTEPSWLATVPAVVVSDGTEIWRYDPMTNTYSHRPPQPSERDVVHALGLGSTVAGSLDRLLDMVRTIGEDGSSAEVVREDTYLGRDVYVVEASPVSGVEGGDTGSATLELWFDKQYFLLLRYELKDPDTGVDGRFGMRFTSLSINGRVDDDELRFVPPTGSTEVEPVDPVQAGSSGHGWSQSPGAPTPPCMPPGYLAPSALPAGYGTTSGGKGTNEHDVVTSAKFELRLGETDAYVVAEEALFGQRIETDDIEGRRVAVNGKPAWLDRRETGLLVLLWQDGDIVVRLMANRLTEAELLAFADSLLPVAEGAVTACAGDDSEGPIIVEEEPTPNPEDLPTPGAASLP